MGDPQGRRQCFAKSLLAYLLEICTARTTESLPSDRISGPLSSSAGVSTGACGLSWPGMILQKTLVLQRVEELTINPGWLDVTWIQLRGLFSLPALKVLQINQMAPFLKRNQDVRGKTLNRAQCTQLRSPVLEKTLMPGSHITALLRICPNLRCFRANWVGFGSLHYDYDPAFEEIGTAVSTHTPLLTGLSLGTWYWRGKTTSRCTRLGYSLRNLEHLTEVTLCDDTVWRTVPPEYPALHSDALADNLPPCIERLRIAETGGRPVMHIMRDDDTGFDDHATDTFSRRRTRDVRRLLLDEGFPRLRSVTFYEAHPAEIPVDDPLELRYFLTEAVRERGWSIVHDLATDDRKVVICRELTEGE